jgi:hypothetical protein
LTVRSEGRTVRRVGNRGGTLFVCRNLMITMLLGGLWHGAAWNYVVWGALHGGGLCANKLWREAGRRLRMPIDVHGGWHVAAVVLTQLWVMLAWVFFRCDSAAQHRGPCRDSRPEASPGRGGTPGRGLHPCHHRDRSHAWELSPQAVAIAPMGPDARVERGRSVVCPRARGDADRAETVHLLPVLRRFTPLRLRDHVGSAGRRYSTSAGVKRVKIATRFAYCGIGRVTDRPQPARTPLSAIRTAAPWLLAPRQPQSNVRRAHPYRLTA